MSVVISGTPIALFCLVRESKAPFKITLGRDNDVSDFKKIIKNEKPNDFAKIDIDNIKLWKLNEPVSSENIEELREITLQDNENVTLLIETNDIVDYWTEDQTPLKKSIHVIVELPEQPVAVNTSKVNTGLVHVFVDNSNLYVEAKYVVGELEKIYEWVKTIDEATKVEKFRQVYYMKHLQIDYGYLLKTILGERSMGSSPVIVGSRPPPDDTLWDEIKKLGYEATVYDRNLDNKEKRVDMKLGVSMVVQTLFKAKSPGVLVLVAGDGDYEPALEEILKAGWKVEIRFWASAISRHLKVPEITRNNIELKTIFKPLDKEYQNFTFCVGPDLTRNKSVFRIEREDMNHNWTSEEIMKCFTELQLFGWWYETDDGSLELYFKSKAHLERADRWMMKNFPNVKAWKIKDVPDELYELPN